MSKFVVRSRLTVKRCLKWRFVLAIIQGPWVQRSFKVRFLRQKKIWIFFLVCEEYLLAGTGGVFSLGFLDIRKELVLDKPKRCFCF